jgi:alkylhydroperoxidase/carboxymuconolactone decarboxylase family protein YurZ
MAEEARAEPVAADELPDVLAEFAGEYPLVWSAYNRLGNASAEAGPLDEKTQRLVKLAIAIGAQRQGAVHSHTRRGLAAGCTPEELVHVGVLAITTIGWPGAFAAICWIKNIIARQKQQEHS